MNVYVLITLTLVILMQVQMTYSTFCYKFSPAYYTCSRRVVESFAEEYSTKCKAFGWWRCQRYRQAFRHVTSYQTCVRYVPMQVCCTGWTGKGCSTHTELPHNTFCPNDMTVNAQSTDGTYVKWTQPRFKEPFGFELSITSTYNGEAASLAWGSHVVRYSARSRNNNKEAHCSFVINVNPPLPVPQIEHYSHAQTIDRTPGETLELTCFAEYGNPQMSLTWLLENEEINNGTKFVTKPSGFKEFFNSYNLLNLTIKEMHDGKSLSCVGTQNGKNQKRTLHLKVTYDPDPVVTFCPADQTVFLTSGKAMVSWEKPEFIDQKGDALRVFCNLPGINDTSDRYEFEWGHHTVTYTGQNQKTGREAKCSFKVKVQTKRCEPLPKPDNGALVCGSWTDGNTEICKVMCRADKDPSLTDKVAALHVCGGSGKWIPPFDPFRCSKNKDTNNPRMPSDLHYFTGNCSTGNTHQMKTNFLSTLKSSIVDDLCAFEECGQENVNIIC